ncbi:MAG: hypothetical protein HYY18_21100 [Planctomycetes bacterium]|nr:hypothetical protein [Planctomycetota bacterium]
MRALTKPGPLLIAAFLAAAAAGCGRDGDPVPIEEKRVLAQPRPEQTVAADTMKRMGAQPDAGRGAGAAAPQLAWDVPEGWAELAPTQLRAANFSVPAMPGLECYVTVLPGGGGGLAANLNRWRKQMGLGPLADAELAALPRVKLLGADAHFLAMDGTYTGGNVEGGLPGYTMAAVALDRPGAAVFVKMIGPTAAVRAEIDRFKSFCASLREKNAEPPPGDGELKWKAPEGWTQGPAKSMRLVTFVPAGTTGVECYVTVLAGTGGGLESNVNRWRSQLKLEPLSAAEIAALPTVPVLGHSAPLVEIYGAESGLLGLVCELGPQTVFVKMTGPTPSLRDERERFVAFCRSLSD